MTITKNIRVAVLALAFFAIVGFVAMPTAKAEAATVSELIAQIQALTAKLNELKAKMSGVAQERNELRAELKANLREGMTDEDITKIQEILATDPSIYPRGLVTGYFGPLTKEALKNFQSRFELKVSGEIDEETREYLEELLAERFGDKIPPGLLRAPGILKKVELRMKEGCDDGKGLAFLCQELKIKYGDDDDDANDDDANDDANDDDANDDANDDEDKGDIDEITVRFDNGRAYMTVEFEDGDDETYTLKTLVEAEVIDFLADKYDMDEEDVEDLIEFDDGSDDVEYIRVEFDGDDSEVDIKYGDDTLESFTLDVTRHNDVIEGIVEETNLDEDEVRDIIEFLDGELLIEVDIDLGAGEADVDITYENGDGESFTLDMTDEDEIVTEIADRTDLTEDEVEDAIDFI